MRIPQVIVAPLRAVTKALVDGALSSRTPTGTAPARGRGPRRPSAKGSRSPRPGPSGGSPDQVGYAPRADGLPDPGEVVWAWVAYEDDPSQGKDRPVLLVGRRGGALLGLMLSSQDHDRDAADEARHGRHWMDVGTGDWDSQGRPSEVRLDRLLVLEAAGVRREGAALARSRFDAVIAAAREHHTLG